MLAAALLFAGCTDTGTPITGTQSLEVKLVSPADGGSVMNRLPDNARSLSVSIRALDQDGNLDTTFTNTLQVYCEFLGTLTPYFDGIPLATVTMTGGTGNLSMTLPPVFGPTTLWIDDAKDDNATFATGVSPTLWFRDPFIADVQTPVNETDGHALDTGPLDTKNIDVRESRYGASGRLVITSVFTQGYTLADVQCADANGTPPCVAHDYDYIEVFSFSAPQDQNRRFVAEGQVTQGFAGGVTEFDGLTEIGFPQTFVAGAQEVNTAREPLPAVMDVSWFTTNKIMFERNEAGPIEIDGGKVCPLDDTYTTFKQWKVDPAGVADAATCAGKNTINVISTSVTELDPATLVGKTLPKLVGIIRPINIASFNVWIIYPRSKADIGTP